MVPKSVGKTSSNSTFLSRPPRHNCAETPQENGDAPMMRGLLPCGFSMLLLSACAGHLPEPGSPEPPPASEMSARPLPRAAHDPPSGNAAIDAAREAAVAGLQACDTVLFAIPNQQLSIKRIAYNRKQGGVLVTTIVGVAGSIVTAVFAGTQSTDASGDVNTKPAVIAGASTAGGTAIAGVVSLFIVGSGADERVELLSQYARQIETAEATFKSQCDKVTDENASTCKAEALRLQNQCTTIEGQLPYTIPHGA